MHQKRGRACEAEETLTRNNGHPLKEDVKHLIVSLAKKDYESLGRDRATRDAAMRVIGRNVVREIAEAAQVSYLEWYGVVHLNRPNAPHIHLGLSKNVIDRKTGRPTRMEHIPSVLLTRNKLNERGEKIAVPGGVSRLVEKEINLRLLEKTRFIELAEHKQNVRNALLVRAVIPRQELDKQFPTKEEITVGKWLIAEWETRAKQQVDKGVLGEDKTRNTGTESSPGKGAKSIAEDELKRLRHEVKLIDAERTIEDLPEVRAYLKRDDLLTLTRPADKTLVDETEDIFIETTTYEDPPQEWTKRQENNRNSRFLGRWMMLVDERERLQARIESIEKYGDFQRFTLRDESHNRERKISVSDVQRRAVIEAQRLNRERQFSSGDERQTALEDARQSVLQRDARTLAAHERARILSLRTAHTKLAKTELEISRLQPAISAVVKKNESAEESRITPYLTSPEVEKLQERALSRDDLDEYKKLEDIRRHNAELRDEPVRDSYQQSRLEAFRILAEAETAVRLKRLEKFDESKHVMRFNVGSETGDKQQSWSLADIAKTFERIDLYYQRAGIIGALLPKIKQERALKLEQIEKIEMQIRNAIGARRITLSEEHLKGQDKATYLSHLAKQIDRRTGLSETPAVTPTPRYQIREMEHLAGFAAELKKPELLHRVAAAEESEISRLSRRDPEKAREVEREFAARAHARFVIADLENRIAIRRESEGKERLQFASLSVTDAGGRQVVTNKWRWEMRTPGEYIYARLLASNNEKTLRRAVDQAYRNELTKLEMQALRAEEFKDATHASAATYEQRFAVRGERLPSPNFSHGELSKLDLHFTSLAPGKEREHYLRLLEESENARPPKDLIKDEREIPGEEIISRDKANERDKVNGRDKGVLEIDDLGEQEALERDAFEHEYVAQDGFEQEHLHASQADEKLVQKLEIEREEQQQARTLSETSIPEPTGVDKQPEVAPIEKARSRDSDSTFRLTR